MGKRARRVVLPFVLYEILTHSLVGRLGRERDREKETETEGDMVTRGDGIVSSLSSLFHTRRYLISFPMCVRLLSTKPCIAHFFL